MTAHKAGENTRTAAELLLHLLDMQQNKGIDLSKIECWGFDDESVVFLDVEELYGNQCLNFNPKWFTK